MTRLYFHLHSDADPLFDEEGHELTLPAAIERAMVEARALIAAEALGGQIDLRQRLQVEDANGVTVHSLTFGDAVRILR